MCKGHKYDVGEYIRAVFNNFEAACDASVKGDCNKTDLLRVKHFGRVGANKIPKLSHFTWAKHFVDNLEQWAGFSQVHNFKLDTHLRSTYTES